VYYHERVTPSYHDKEASVHCPSRNMLVFSVDGEKEEFQIADVQSMRPLKVKKSPLEPNQFTKGLAITLKNEGKVISIEISSARNNSISRFFDLLFLRYRILFEKYQISQNNFKTVTNVLVKINSLGLVEYNGEKTDKYQKMPILSRAEKAIYQNIPKDLHMMEEVFVPDACSVPHNLQKIKGFFICKNDINENYLDVTKKGKTAQIQEICYGNIVEDKKKENDAKITITLTTKNKLEYIFVNPDDTSYLTKWLAYNSLKTDILQAITLMNVVGEESARKTIFNNLKKKVNDLGFPPIEIWKTVLQYIDSEKNTDNLSLFLLELFNMELTMMFSSNINVQDDSIIL
jgi:hypothetical protein